MNDTVDGCVFPKTARATKFHIESLKATPGYFALELETGVRAEMTTTYHTALYRFQFPQSSSKNGPMILLDLTDLSESRQDNASANVDPDTGRMTGNGRFLPSFGTGDYVLYYCIDFHGSSIKDSGIWVNSRGSDKVDEVKISKGINSGGPLPGGAFVRFKTSDPVMARVGLSFRSSEQACSIAESEIGTWDFVSVHSAAVEAWRTKLGPITVSTHGVNTSLIKNFYSGIYRTMVNPQNYTGFVPEAIAPSGRLWFDSYYWSVFLQRQQVVRETPLTRRSLWDSFRSQFPFLTVIDTPSLVELIKGLLNIYQAQGWLPDCHMSLCKGYTQGGSNADNIMSDAYQKIGGTEIDWDLAYEAVVKDAEEEPYGNTRGLFSFRTMLI